MQGGCLCGAVRYEVKNFESNIANCFCNMCQKSSGSAFATFASVKAENFRWISGENKIQVYQSSKIASRGFCSCCGSNLYYLPTEAGAFYEIAFGTLDEEPEQKPNANIFCESKKRWSKDVEDLPSFEQGRQ